MSIFLIMRPTFHRLCKSTLAVFRLEVQTLAAVLDVLASLAAIYSTFSGELRTTLWASVGSSNRCE